MSMNSLSYDFPKTCDYIQSKLKEEYPETTFDLENWMNESSRISPKCIEERAEAILEDFNHMNLKKNGILKFITSHQESLNFSTNNEKLLHYVFKNAITDKKSKDQQAIKRLFQQTLPKQNLTRCQRFLDEIKKIYNLSIVRLLIAGTLLYHQKHMLSFFKDRVFVVVHSLSKSYLPTKVLSVILKISEHPIKFMIFSSLAPGLMQKMVSKEGVLHQLLEITKICPILMRNYFALSQGVVGFSMNLFGIFGTEWVLASDRFSEAEGLFVKEAILAQKLS